MKNLFAYIFLRLLSGLRLSNNNEERFRQVLVYATIIVVGYFMYSSYQNSKNQVLLSAARTGDTEAIEASLRAGSHIAANDVVGRTALHLAARYNREDAVYALLNQGADPDIQDYKGRTALHIAHFDGSNNEATIRVLLEWGANPNMVDDDGKTPLDVVIERRKHSFDLRQLLRANGALTGAELSELWSFKAGEL